MMNTENLENMENEYIVALSEEELKEVAGGTRYIEGDTGKSFVHPYPDKNSKRLGTLHRGEDARYLGETAVDDRGVLWYKIRWNGRDAWVSSMYTRKVKY